MKKFSEYVQETTDYIRQYKQSKANVDKLKSHGFKHTRTAKLEGDKKRHDYEGPRIKKDDSTSYQSYLNYTQDPQSGKHHDIKTAFHKNTWKSENHLAREKLHSKKHSSIEDAIKHINALNKFHSEE